MLSNIQEKVLSFVVRKGTGVSAENIAKKLRLNQSTVRQSLKRMREKDIILKEEFMLNYPLLGFKSAFVFFKINQSGLGLESFAEKITKEKGVAHVFIITGDYDLGIKIVRKSFSAITNTVMEMEKKFSDSIENSSIVICSSVHKLDYCVLEKNEKIECDKTMKKILGFKIENPDAAISAVSKALEIHRNTAGKKWKEALQKKIVLKKKPVIAKKYHAQLGIKFNAVMLFDAVTGKSEELAEKISELDETKEVVHGISHHDLLAIVTTADIDGFYNFHRKIYLNPKYAGLIKETKSLVIMVQQEHNLNPFTKI